VRDAEALGIYKALGVPASSVTSLKGPRLDIINTINLGRPIPIAERMPARATRRKTPDAGAATSSPC